MQTVENIFGRSVVEKALLYANHEWYATEKNVMHGMDANGFANKNCSKGYTQYCRMHRDTRNKAR